MASKYSMIEEAQRLLSIIASSVQLPIEVQELLTLVTFKGLNQNPYFPIPLKETEVTAALKAIEGCVVSALANSHASILIDLERTTAFLCQTYLSTVDGYQKLDPESKKYLKDTDLLRAQSNPYRRMSANLFKTKSEGQYYHIHGSLEASTTLRMIGLEPYRPDLTTHEAITNCIEPQVEQFTVEELEALNKQNRQAGAPALKHEDFVQTPHGKANVGRPPWTVEGIEDKTPPIPVQNGQSKRVLAGIKVLELCRVIAGPTMGRILAEYGADVLKITSPRLSDVPFFQIDGNIGKHTADLDLKDDKDRAVFESLLAEADVILDGYRPGSLERLGYGIKRLSELAIERNKGYIYVNENCFGYEGEWAYRAGWQQIADCISGVAWEQGKFMGLNEPVVPPFPISDYGTGCMGAIAALTGLLQRAVHGGSWHGKTSLLQYDLLLFSAGKYQSEVIQELRNSLSKDFASFKHHNTVDQISGAALRMFEAQYPALFDPQHIIQTHYSEGFKAKVQTVRPVVQIDGVDNSFLRATRPNGFDLPKWNFEDDVDKNLFSVPN